MKQKKFNPVKRQQFVPDEQYDRLEFDRKITQFKDISREEANDIATINNKEMIKKVGRYYFREEIGKIWGNILNKIVYAARNKQFEVEINMHDALWGTTHWNRNVLWDLTKQLLIKEYHFDLSEISNDVILLQWYRGRAGRAAKVFASSRSKSKKNLKFK